MFHGISFQFHRASLYAPWYAFSIEWLQPIVQALVVAALASVAIYAYGNPVLWRQPARLAALCGALLLGVQLSASQWTYTYFAWAFPLVLVALLVERAPPARASAARASDSPALPVRGEAAQLRAA